MNAHIADILRGFADELFRRGIAIIVRVIDDAGMGIGLLQTGDGFQQFLLAVAGDARNAQNFAAECLEGDVIQHTHAFGIGHTEVVNAQTEMRIDRFGSFDVQFNLFADHHFGQRRLACACGFHRADVFAFAQDGHAVGNLQHLVQLVGDDDDGFSILTHVAHDAEQLLRFLRREHGGRFVQNQNLRAAIEHFDDFKRLLLADAHFIDLLIQINIKCVAVADFARLLTDGLEVIFFVLIHHERDVFHRREYVDELEMLVNHADSQRVSVLGAADFRRLLIDLNFAAVRIIDTGDHVHQGGFAASVFAQQGENFAAADGQKNVFVGNDVAESLGDMAQFNGVLHKLPLTPSSR